MSRGCRAWPSDDIGDGKRGDANSVLDPARRLRRRSAGRRCTGVALVDPDLTLPLPPRPAHSGLDALCQAIEAYVSRGANPVSDLWALRAVQAIGARWQGPWPTGATGAIGKHGAGGHLAGLALASAWGSCMASPPALASGKPHGLVCEAMLPMVIAQAGRREPLRGSLRAAGLGAPSPRRRLERWRGGWRALRGVRGAGRLAELGVRRTAQIDRDGGGLGEPPALTGSRCPPRRSWTSCAEPLGPETEHDPFRRLNLSGCTGEYQPRLAEV